MGGNENAGKKEGEVRGVPSQMRKKQRVEFIDESTSLREAC